MKEIFKYGMDVLKNALLGKDVIIGNFPDDSDYTEDNVWVPSRMREFDGKRVTIEKMMYNGSSIVFKIPQDCYQCIWPLSLIKYVVDNTGDTESLYKFKKGDLVKIKSNDKSLKTTDTTILGIPVVKGMQLPKEIENKKIVITDIVNDNVIVPYYVDSEYAQEIITTGMVELLEEDYIQKIEEQKEKTRIGAAKQKILNDLKIMEEMKSKVDVKQFKKIIAGSIKAIPNELKGIELVLNEWAFNKKRLYEMFGNELSISQKIEYEKDIVTIEQDRQSIYREFPGTYYVIDRLENRELLENKLHHTLNESFTRYSRQYKPGEKVSKMLDEAFKNEKLNIFFSNIVAQNKIKGIIEISIDPIEYLLMSCNVSGWTSCHTIYKFGCGVSYGGYSAGIFSYMCDSASLIAFRHDGKLYDYQIIKQKVQAYSKNWRQMIWINKKLDAFVASRQYPNYVPEIAKSVRELLEDKIDEKTEDKSWVHSDKKEKMQEIINDKKWRKSGSLHYNDILHGYDGDLCYKKSAEIEKVKITVGTHPACPQCGKEIISYSSHPVCDRCEHSF